MNRALPEVPPEDRTNFGAGPRLNSAARRAVRAAARRRLRRVLTGCLSWSGWVLAASLWLASNWRPMASVPAGVPVVVRTDVSWAKAYVDSSGVARYYEDGRPIPRPSGWMLP